MLIVFHKTLFETVLKPNSVNFEPRHILPRTEQVVVYHTLE